MSVRDLEFISSFGNMFRQKRIKSGLTQEELAYKTDVTLSQIARIETGRINPTICTLKILSEGMGITLQELFEGV